MTNHVLGLVEPLNIGHVGEILIQYSVPSFNFYSYRLRLSPLLEVLMSLYIQKSNNYGHQTVSFVKRLFNNAALHVSLYYNIP